MTFYIKPPGGTLSLKKLHQDAEIRLLFLHQLHHQSHGTKYLNTDKILAEHPNIALNSECLIDGSLRDRISHFILRLASQKNKSFKTFLIEAETYLFKSKVTSGGQAALKHSLQSLERHTRFALKHQVLSFHHHELLQHILIMVHQVSASGMLNCEDRSLCQHSISVPWTMANMLVKDRSVIVANGRAVLLCRLLMQFLYSVFQDVLTCGIKELSVAKNPDIYLSDTRMHSIVDSLISTFLRLGGRSKFKISFTLTSASIDLESKFFPLCMRLLHSLLSKTNRLRHHARFRYTVFLKDIGLPVAENITFWERFYSKPYSGTSTSCSHSWTGSSEKKYLYGIRHLYGLEGGRINYTSHSCTALQALSPQPSEMAGCPFTNRNNAVVLSTLKSFYGENLFLEEIMKQVSEQKPTTACKLLMRYSNFSTEEHSLSRVEENSLHKNGFESKGFGEQTRKCLSSQKYVYIEQMDDSVYNAALSDEALKGRNKVRCDQNERHKDYNGKKVFPAQELNRVNGNEIHMNYSKNESNEIAVKSNNKQEGSCKLYFNSLEDVNKSCRYDVGECSSCASSKSQGASLLLHDIEDCDSYLSKCNFLRPSEYYLFVKSNR